MNERVEVNHTAPVPDLRATTGSTTTSLSTSWPGREERLARIQAYQTRALENPNPHLANIELFDGDTMLLALLLRESMDKELVEGTATAEASRRFAQRSELFLKCIRQIDRNARVKRQLAQLAKEDSALG